MIYILEGADGTGKSTLANEIAKQKHGQVLHPYYDKTWNMEKYHIAFIESAILFANEGIPVILDRWAPSEFVYGDVFRNGPSFDTSKLIEKYQDLITEWIYCRNDNAIENHLKNKETREEMFDDMSQVVTKFDYYIEYTSNNWLHIPWKIYDFDKVNMKQFVKDLK